MARLKLGSRLRQQDWVAFAIDLCIVVVGVFLGIQASNWNDQRRERQLGRVYLDRIDGDLRYDLKQLRRREDYWRTTAEDGKRALEFAEEGSVDKDDWATLLDFYGAGQIWTYSSTDATYNELLSAGRLNFIKDDKLKRELSDYYVGRRAQDSLLFDALPPYSADIRATVPYRIQRYIFERCGASVLNGFRPVTCPAPLDLSEISSLNRRLAEDSRLMGELRSWMVIVLYTRGVGIEHQQLAKRLIGEVEKAKSAA